MIDIKKKYKTRDGRNVRLISDLGSKDYPIVGFIEDAICPSCWSSGGIFKMGGFYNASDRDRDLIEVKEKKVRKYWVNFYRDGLPGIWDTKEFADNLAQYKERIGEAVEVTLEYEE